MLFLYAFLPVHPAGLPVACPVALRPLQPVVRKLLLHPADRRGGGSDPPGVKISGEVPKEKLSSRKVFVTSGAFCILLILSLSVLGYVNARNIRTTHYEVTVDKSCQDLSSLRIVLAADLHLGYNMGNDQMKRMVEKINAADPDLVVIAGDFFDNDFDAVEDRIPSPPPCARSGAGTVLTPATATTTSRRRSWPASPSLGRKKGKRPADGRFPCRFQYSTYAG